MRIKQHFDPFHRPSYKNATEEIKPKKKFFVAFEGNVTEHLYFPALIKTFSNERVIYLEQESSNPQIIAERIIGNLTQVQPFKICKQEIVGTIEEYCADSNILISDEKIKTLVNKAIEEEGLHNNDDFDIDAFSLVVNNVCAKISRIRLQNCISSNSIINILQERVSFSYGFDEIIIIVDRDKKSFTEQQYDKVLKICKENSIHLFITNPCIEFWFLLHFSNCKKIKEQLKENAVDSHKHTFAYQELKKYDPNYSKHNINLNTYLPKFNTAIKNSANFSDDLDTIKTEVGTNLQYLKGLFKEKHD